MSNSTRSRPPLTWAPTHSIALYRHAAMIEEHYGTDFLFLTGRTEAEGLAEGQKDARDYLPLGDALFRLAAPVAHNLALPQALTNKQARARLAFRRAVKAHKIVSPTLDEVREQKGEGAGLSLLSLGGWVFVAPPAPQEAILPLFKRTAHDNYGRIADPSGLAAGPEGAIKFMQEECTPVLLTQAESGAPQAIVYAVSFSAQDTNYGMRLKVDRQRAQILSAVQAIDPRITNAALSFAVAPLRLEEELSPHHLILLDHKGDELARHRGVLGYEKDKASLLCRSFGVWEPQAKGKLIFVDAEPFGRPQISLTREALTTLPRKEAISSVHGIAQTLKETGFWPKAPGPRPQANGPGLF